MLNKRQKEENYNKIALFGFQIAIKDGENRPKYSGAVSVCCLGRAIKSIYMYMKSMRKRKGWGACDRFFCIPTYSPTWLVVVLCSLSSK